MSVYKNIIELSTALTRSLVVKSHDAAIQINRYIENFNGIYVDPNDPTTWKYYLNLSGEKHSTNGDVYIKTIETGVSVELTKNNLALYPVTHKELLKFGSTYEDLVAKQPEDELYIKGVMLNIDINNAIEADDGAVLGYSTELLEDQEIDIIREIATYSTLFMERWRNRLYGFIDELYVPSLMAILTSKIVVKIVNIRLANIGTHKVHTYFIREFFKSNFGISSEIEHLNKESLLWLYLNFDNVRKNVGSNKTFEVLIEKILTDNMIGSSRVNISKALPVLADGVSDNTSIKLYDRKDVYGILKPDNEYIEVPLGGKESIDVIVDSEFGSTGKTILTEKVDDYIESTKDIAAKAFTNGARTKVVKFRYSYFEDLVKTLLVKHSIDNWFYYADRNIYKPVISVMDPNTGKQYTMSPYQSMLVFIKLMAILYTGDKEANPEITNYILSASVVRTYASSGDAKAALLDDLPSSTMLDAYVDELINRMPALYGSPYFSTTDSFKLYMDDLEKTTFYVASAISNANDSSLADQMAIIFYRCFIDNDVVDFNDTYESSYIDDMLSANDIAMFISGDYDPALFMDTISFELTGQYVTKDLTAVIVEAYKNMVTKLSSYTVQPINDPKNNGVIDFKYMQPITSASVRGAAKIIDAIFRALEIFAGQLAAAAGDFEEELYVEDESVAISALGVSNTPSLISSYSLYTNNRDGLIAEAYVPAVYASIRGGAVAALLLGDIYDGIMASVANERYIENTAYPTTRSAPANGSNSVSVSGDQAVRAVISTDSRVLTPVIDSYDYGATIGSHTWIEASRNLIVDFPEVNQLEPTTATFTFVFGDAPTYGRAKVVRLRTSSINGVYPDISITTDAGSGVESVAYGKENIYTFDDYIFATSIHINLTAPAAVRLVLEFVEVVSEQGSIVYYDKSQRVFVDAMATNPTITYSGKYEGTNAAINESNGEVTYTINNASADELDSYVEFSTDNILVDFDVIEFTFKATLLSGEATIVLVDGVLGSGVPYRPEVRLTLIGGTVTYTVMLNNAHAENGSTGRLWLDSRKVGSVKLHSFAYQPAPKHFVTIKNKTFADFIAFDTLLSAADLDKLNEQEDSVKMLWHGALTLPSGVDNGNVTVYYQATEGMSHVTNNGREQRLIPSTLPNLASLTGIIDGALPVTENAVSVTSAITPSAFGYDISETEGDVSTSVTLTFPINLAALPVDKTGYHRFYIKFNAENVKGTAICSVSGIRGLVTERQAALDTNLIKFTCDSMLECGTTWVCGELPLSTTSYDCTDGISCVTEFTCDSVSTSNLIDLSSVMSNIEIQCDAILSCDTEWSCVSNAVMHTVRNGINEIPIAILTSAGIEPVEENIVIHFHTQGRVCGFEASVGSFEISYMKARQIDEFVDATRTLEANTLVGPSSFPMLQRSTGIDTGKTSYVNFKNDGRSANLVNRVGTYDISVTFTPKQIPITLYDSATDGSLSVNWDGSIEASSGIAKIVAGNMAVGNEVTLEVEGIHISGETELFGRQEASMTYLRETEHDTTEKPISSKIYLGNTRYDTEHTVFLKNASATVDDLPISMSNGLNCMGGERRFLAKLDYSTGDELAPNTTFSDMTGVTAETGWYNVLGRMNYFANQAVSDMAYFEESGLSADGSIVISFDCTMNYEIGKLEIYDGTGTILLYSNPNLYENGRIEIIATVTNISGIRICAYKTHEGEVRGDIFIDNLSVKPFYGINTGAVVYYDILEKRPVQILKNQFVMTNKIAHEIVGAISDCATLKYPMTELELMEWAKDTDLIRKVWFNDKSISSGFDKGNIQRLWLGNEGTPWAEYVPNMAISPVNVGMHHTNTVGQITTGNNSTYTLTEIEGGYRLSIDNVINSYDLVKFTHVCENVSHSNRVTRMSCKLKVISGTFRMNNKFGVEGISSDEMFRDLGFTYRDDELSTSITDYYAGDEYNMTWFAEPINDMTIFPYLLMLFRNTGYNTNGTVVEFTDFKADEHDFALINDYYLDDYVRTVYRSLPYGPSDLKCLRDYTGLTNSYEDKYIAPNHDNDLGLDTGWIPNTSLAFTLAWIGTKNSSSKVALEEFGITGAGGNLVIANNQDGATTLTVSGNTGGSIEASVPDGKYVAVVTWDGNNMLSLSINGSLYQSISASLGVIDSSFNMGIVSGDSSYSPVKGMMGRFEIDTGVAWSYERTRKFYLAMKTEDATIV